MILLQFTMFRTVFSGTALVIPWRKQFRKNRLFHIPVVTTAKDALPQEWRPLRLQSSRGLVAFSDNVVQK